MTDKQRQISVAARALQNAQWLHDDVAAPEKIIVGDQIAGMKIMLNTLTRGAREQLVTQELCRNRQTDKYDRDIEQHAYEVLQKAFTTLGLDVEEED